jgi:hypothetical protein
VLHFASSIPALAQLAMTRDPRNKVDQEHQQQQDETDQPNPVACRFGPNPADAKCGDAPP